MQSNSTELFKLENTASHRQPRFIYGPLLGLLLANVISNAAIARLSPLGALRISYEPTPWLPYNRPSHDQHSPYHHDNSWHPVEIPYSPPPPPTTSPSYSTDGQQVHHYHINPPNQQQIVNINGHPPTAIIIGGDDTNDANNAVTENSSLSTIIEDNNYLETIKTNIESPDELEPIAAESLIAPVQQTATSSTEMNIATTLKTKKSVKRGVTSRHTPIKKSKYNAQKRRRYTTPEYYYDSYEDFTTNKYKVNRRTKPRKPIDSYEDNTEDYEYDSYEFTTKPYRKRRRTTLKSKRNKNKRKQQKITALDNYDDTVNDYDKVEPLTQIVVVRQRQESTTTPETMITNGTTITTSTTTTQSTNITGYGYGPSNGNENISITYGPPQGDLPGVYGYPRPSYGPPRPTYGPPLGGYYHIPFAEWYSSHETGRNAALKKVHDITGFDNVFQ